MVESRLANMQMEVFVSHAQPAQFGFEVLPLPELLHDPKVALASNGHRTPPAVAEKALSIGAGCYRAITRHQNKAVLKRAVDGASKQLLQNCDKVPTI